MKTRLMMLALLTLALLATAPAASAQQDSVTVTVIDRTDLEVVITPEGPVRRFRGDSVQFSAVAVDTVSGDTLAVEFLWTSTNSNVLTIDSETGMARFLSRGNAQVVVEVVQLVSLILVGQQDDGTWFELTDSYPVAQNAWRPICAYGQRNDGSVTLMDDPGLTHEWTLSDGVPSSADARADLHGEGPRAVFTEATVEMASPTLPDCPPFGAVLPTMPMPQQIDFLLRQQAASSVG